MQKNFKLKMVKTGPVVLLTISAMLVFKDEAEQKDYLCNSLVLSCFSDLDFLV